MKKVIYKIKFHWHSIQYNKNQLLLDGCNCQQTKKNIESKIHYHERAVIDCITKI